MSDVAMVLTEAEAMELFAYLLTSARTQLDEPCQYASMRLLTAAELVRDSFKARASADAQGFLSSTEPKTAFAQTHTNDAEAYASVLDELCAMVARQLVRRAGAEEGRRG
jgi:hypothetical protein